MVPATKKTKREDSDGASPSKRRDWGQYTHLPLNQTQLSKNGRQKGRNLITWNRKSFEYRYPHINFLSLTCYSPGPRMYEKLLLHIQYECARQRVDIPWHHIAHRLSTCHYARPSPSPFLCLLPSIFFLLFMPPSKSRLKKRDINAVFLGPNYKVEWKICGWRSSIHARCDNTADEVSKILALLETPSPSSSFVFVKLWLPKVTWYLLLFRSLVLPSRTLRSVVSFANSLMSELSKF